MANTRKRLMTEADVVDELRRQASASSQAEVAQRVRLSRQFICDVLQGRRGVTSILASALGFEREVRYRKVK